MVSKAEFRLAIRSLAISWGADASREDIDALFDSFDADTSGTISYDELHTLAKLKQEPMERIASSDLPSADTKKPSRPRVTRPPVDYFPAQLQRYPLRSKGASLPSFSKLTSGIELLQDEQADALGRHPAAVNPSRLRSQIRGYDTGLDAQVSSRMPSFGESLSRSEKRLSSAGIGTQLRSGLMEMGLSPLALPLHTGLKPRTKPSKPWAKDPRCNPASRFFNTPNVSHLAPLDNAGGFD